MTSLPFIHLHVHSAYSLAEGAIKVKDLVKTCVKNNIPAVAITDTNNLFGAMEFALEAVKAGVQPIIGVELQMEQDGSVVLLVQNDAGYKNLCKLVSTAHLNAYDIHAPAATWQDLRTYSGDLICLTGGARGPVGRALATGQIENAKKHLDTLKAIFSDRLYVEIERHHEPIETQIEPDLIALANSFDLPLVATNNAYFSDSDMHAAHDALLCIAEGRYISEDDRRKETPEHYLKNHDEMVELFADLPDAIENTAKIAERCSFILKPIKPLLPKFADDENEELRREARVGLAWRLDNYVLPGIEAQEKREEITKQYQDRLEFELNVIIQMKFPGYFLIVSDFIKWAKDHDIPVGPGRGSGVGSLVAWSLKITDLDPIPLNLLFERFLNPERVSMPDFDVDFCQDRRDEVIRYVQERYGEDRVAQIITFGKLQARAVVRDVGRVLQMSYGQVDRIAKRIPQNPTHPISLEDALAADPELSAELNADETSSHLIDIALQLEGLYRHASTHAAGVVIGDRPLTDLVALYRDPRATLPATQFNMKYVEQAGLVKYDFLGLKTLTVIKRALEYIRTTTGQDIDILKIPLDDPKTYAYLNTGDTTGLFQIESAGMRDAMKKIKPSRFEDIIALVAMYRPGPMENIPVYANIKDGRENPDYLHDKLEPVLKESYGIMVYQEQVMQAAQVLCGYSLGGADLLRRAMGKKIKAEMDAQRDGFVKGAMETSGLTHARASEIFDIIAKFADYGFNKSHAAAYALITYQTAWLKTHYPVEFMAASMTLDKGNTDKLAVFKQAVDRMKIPLLPPDINISDADFKVEGQGIRYALAALKGVGDQAMRLVVDERTKSGPFRSLADFLSRIDPKWINRRQIEVLAASGAFECFNPNRAAVYAGADHLLAHAHRIEDERATGQVNLFGAETNALNESDIILPQDRWDPLEKLQHEFDAVGFYLSAHPLDARRAQLERMGIMAYADIPSLLQTRASMRTKLAGVVIRKQEKMSKSGRKFAFLQLSDSTGVYEATVFSDTLSAARDLMVAGNALLLSADAEMQEDLIRVTIQDVKPLDEALIRQVRQVTLDLDDTRAIPELQKILAGDKNGAVKMRVRVPAAGRHVVLALPGSYSYPATMRDALYQIDGLKGLNEA